MSNPSAPPHEPIRTLRIEGADVEVFAGPADACLAAAAVIARSVAQARARRGKAVLGLATGKTPIPVYARLVELHRAGELSFAGVSTYNLDEYYPISPADPRSYRRYMHEHLFRDAVDLAPNAAHVLDGSVPEFAVPAHTAEFDRWILEEGGLDLQLLGIGRNGHIGFNEPSDLTVSQAIALPTRLVPLHPVTLADAAGEFEGVAAGPPRRALTVGLASILAARTIVVLAFGASKAAIVARAIEGPITAEVPASLLRTVPPGRVVWMLDAAAAGELDESLP
jgi:glucosamine-6-phosphate deaminase